MKRCFISTIAVAIAILMFSPAVSAAMLDAETGELTGDITLENDNNFSISDIADDSTNSLMLLSFDEFDEIEPTEYMGRKIISKMDNGDFLLEIYDKMVECGESVCDLSPDEVTLEMNKDNYKVLEKNFQMVFNAFHNDYPQHFFYTGITLSGTLYNGKYTITFTPTIDKQTIETETRKKIIKMRSAFEQRISQIITALEISPDMSDFEKAVILHDELVYSIEYEEVENSHNAYGAIIGQGEKVNKAVCEGYARAYQYLLYKVGVLSHIATGTGGGGPHAWNYICIDNKWYHTDLTWDDPVGANDIFYTYFNLSTEQIESMDHEVDMLYPEIECTETEDNYYKKYKSILYSEYSEDGISDSEKALLQSIAKQLESSNRARIYNADSLDRTSIGTWLSSHLQTIKNMISDDSVKEKLQNPQIILYSNGECHIILFDISFDSSGILKSSVTADKNGYISIVNNSGKTLKLLRIFYNNGIISDTEICEISQSQLVFLNLQQTILHEEYDDIKYLLWDEVTGLTPICNMYEVEY